MMIFAFAISRDRHAERGRKGSRSVAGAERVVFRFIAPQKAADAAVLLDRRKLIAASGQDFVRIRLMTNIPNQTILRRIERIMQGHRQFDSPERSTRVPAHARHGFQNVLANLVGYGLQFIRPQPSQVGGRIDLFQQIHCGRLYREMVTLCILTTLVMSMNDLEMRVVFVP